MSTIYENIHNLYKDKGFIDTYLFDIFITFILVIVFFVAISYYYVMNNIKPILADWDNQKCSPSVMPFAGLINNGATTTKLEFTTKNFAACMHTMVSGMAADAFQPIYYILNAFTALFSDLKDALKTVRAEFDKIRKTVDMFTADVMNRALNVLLPILKMVVGMKTMLAKVNGVLSASLYTLFGSYLSLKSMFMVFLEMVNTILIALVASIIASIAIAFFFPPAAIIAAGTAAIMTMILVPSLLIQHFVLEIFQLNSSSFPSVPSCFSANTLLKMADSSYKKIGEIEPGDLLYANIKISAVLKCSAKGQTIYRLADVIVTGEHRVYHPVKGWIKVKNHEASQRINDFAEPFVFCLNTDTKTLTINHTLFSDWDDIDDSVISHLEEKCVNKGYLPPKFSGKDIHLYLENGLEGSSSFVSLQNGESVALQDIKVNDILDAGQRVLGVVKINMTDMPILYDYCFEKKMEENYLERKIETLHKTFICSTRNIQIGKKNLIECTEHFQSKEQKGTDCFYQLLVEGGTFLVNGISVGDYNTGLDKFLL
jgi:hypothetical protein